MKGSDERSPSADGFIPGEPPNQLEEPVSIHQVGGVGLAVLRIDAGGRSKVGHTLRDQGADAANNVIVALAETVGHVTGDGEHLLDDDDEGGEVARRALNEISHWVLQPRWARMSLPPVSLPKPVEEFISEALKPSARKIGIGLAMLVKAVFLARIKSPEEIALDAAQGDLAAWTREEQAIAELRKLAEEPNRHHQRILAMAVAKYVPPERFVMPPLQIAGKVFTQSEFDQAEPQIWEMWVQLLSRACDKERVGEAHPSFPLIISQLSSDEAKLLSALSLYNRRSSDFQGPPPRVFTSKIGVTFPENLTLYIDHLTVLGLMFDPGGWGEAGMEIWVDERQTHLLSDFGIAFMRAVSSPGQT